MVSAHHLLKLSKNRGAEPLWIHEHAVVNQRAVHSLKPLASGLEAGMRVLDATKRKDRDTVPPSC